MTKASVMRQTFLKCCSHLLSELIAEFDAVLINHSGKRLTEALSSNTEHTMSTTSIVHSATRENQFACSSC